jgi:SNF2 family DNA or RNA helicase
MNSTTLQYILLPVHQDKGLPLLGLQVFCKRDGKSARHISFETLFESIDQFQEADQKLLSWLKFAFQQQQLTNPADQSLILFGEFGAEVLPVLLASKRCHWLSTQSPSLQEGEARSAALEWQSEGNKLRKLKCHLAGRSGILFNLKPLWYFDQHTWQCGIAPINVDHKVLNKLLEAPAMTDQQIRTLENLLGNIGAAQEKKQTVTENIETAQMKPVLNLLMLSVQADNPYDASKKIILKVPAVELSFHYANKNFLAYDQTTDLALRNSGEEIEAIRLLRHTGLIDVRETKLPVLDLPTESACFVFPSEDGSAWLSFNLKELPEFKKKGWRIKTAADYPYHVVEESDIEWYTQLEDVGQHNWFDVELGIHINGEKINLLPLIVSALENLVLKQGGHIENLPIEEHLLAKLPDGRLLPIPIARLKPILNVLTELFDRQHLNKFGKMRLSRVRAAQLLALEKESDTYLKMRWWGTQSLEALAHQLEHVESCKPVATPQCLQTELRPYQQLGLNWLQFLREFQLGGILADDMGLGKTVQTLAHIAIEKESGRLKKPCLVVCPTTLITNWLNEAKKYCPELRVLLLHGISRQEHFDKIENVDLVLTTYPLIVRDYEILEKKKFHLLILDEAQIIKNARSKAALYVNHLQAGHRVCLTGTPLENHLGELWSLFNFLMPGFLGDSKQFARFFRIPIERQQDQERKQILKNRIAPFMLRRTKQSVALELPAKNEITQVIELETIQRDLYESVRLSLNENIQLAIEKRGLANSQIIILDALLKLRQVCCDPRLLKLSSAQKVEAGSAKLQYLCDALPSMIEEGRRILLFSQFTEMLGLIEQEVKRMGIDYVKLTGQTQDRAAPINDFQEGKAPLFLISLKAGGLGLNLTAADTVIHYDPWWNPAVERQATDRAYRIGQNKSVFVYKLIMAGTIEEKILALQERKKELLDIFDVDDTEGAKKISAADLQMILGYIT